MKDEWPETEKLNSEEVRGGYLSVRYSVFVVAQIWE